MKKLLEELKKIDPACYDEIWQWSLWMEEDERYTPNDPKYINHRNDVIQGACQRACTARKWSVTQQSTMWYEGEQYDAEICDLDANTIGEATADSHAEAILTCYLAAMKAQP